jgi:gluconolactonase
VANPGLWPEVQRFDFMVRERPARSQDMPAKPAAGEVRPPSEHQKVLFFALRELTGLDPGPSVEDWKRLFLRTTAPVRLHAGLKSCGGVAVDDRGVVYAADKGQSTLLLIRGTEVRTVKNDTAFDALAIDGKGRLIACRPGRVVAVDPDSGGETVLADSERTPNLRHPSFAAADRQGGLYLSVREGTEGEKTPGAVYYLSAQGTLTHLPITLKRPRGLAVSPDGKTLYVACGDSADVYAFTMESVGNPANGRILAKLDAVKGEAVVGGGVAVDGQGNVFVTHPARRAVQIFGPTGARLGLVSLPEAPLHVALGGEGRKQLVVSSAENVYAAELIVGPGVAARER